MANKLANAISKLFQVGGRKQTKQFVNGALLGYNPNLHSYVTDSDLFTLSQFMGAVDLVANDFSKLKFSMKKVKQTSDKFRYLADINDSSMNYILSRQPHRDQNIHDFLKLIPQHILLKGRFAAYIYRRAGVVREIIPMDPERINPVKDENGNKFYKLNLADGDKIVNYNDIIFLPYTDFSAGYTDLDFKTIHQTLISNLKNLNDLDAGVIQNTHTFVGTLESPEDLDEAQVTEIRNRFQSMMNGAKDSGAGVLILDPKYKYTPMTGNDERGNVSDEFRKNIIRGLSIALHIPIAKLGYEDGTFKNRVDLNIDYIKEAVQPYADAFIAELNSKIAGTETKFEFTYDSYSLIKLNFDQISKVGPALIQSGVMTPNEVRKYFLGLPATEEGGKLLVNSAIRPLDKIAEAMDAEIEGKRTGVNNNNTDVETNNNNDAKK